MSAASARVLGFLSELRPIPARLDVTAKAALLRDILDVADRQPDIPRVDARGEGLGRRAAPDPGKDEGAAQHA